MNNRDDSATVRISNISSGTSEADLDELCKVFGNIRRIFLSRDRDTGESRGFAFVAFVNVSDAARCIERLNGHGYDHLICRLSGRNRRNRGMGKVAVLDRRLDDKLRILFSSRKTCGHFSYMYDQRVVDVGSSRSGTMTQRRIWDHMESSRNSNCKNLFAP